jgi:hypothetical protein
VTGAARALAAVGLALVANAGAAPPLPREAFSATVREIQEDFVADRFEHLEALHQRDMGRRVDDGTSMIEAFEYAFDSVFGVRPLVRLEAGFAAWKVAAPRSRLRPIAEAFMWQERAFRAHGAWCQPLDPAGKPLATKYLARAQAALAEADPAASPLWFTASLRVAGGQGATTDRLDRLLDQGAAAHPGYLPMYWARGRFMLPPWSEDYSGFDTFARTRTPGGREGGATSYALLYATVARDTCQGFLEATAVSWPRMRTGLEALVRDRDTPWNWNLLGTFSCRFRDAEATRRVLARMGPAAQLDIWTSGQSTQSCTLMSREPPARRHGDDNAQLTGVKVAGARAFLYSRQLPR